jgi:hypothetical protein
VALPFHFLQRQILSCANLGVNSIDLVGMELIFLPIEFLWYSDGFYQETKRTLQDLSHRYRFSIFDLSDAILKDAKKISV